jgi:hypothetical protein
MMRPGGPPVRSCMTRVTSRTLYNTKRRTRRCRHGSSPKIGSWRRRSGEEDGGLPGPRATLVYGDAPCPKQGGWEAMRRAGDGTWRRLK